MLEMTDGEAEKRPDTSCLLINFTKENNEVTKFIIIIILAKMRVR